MLIKNHDFGSNLVKNDKFKNYHFFSTSRFFALIVGDDAGEDNGETCGDNLGEPNDNLCLKKSKYLKIIKLTKFMKCE